MARIEIIEYESSEQRLREIYDELIKKRGQLANVHKIQSLLPESIQTHMALYMEIMFSHNELSRAERELIGTVVSKVNGCQYCTKHHADALNHYWKNDDRIEKLKQFKFEEILSSKEIAMVEYSKHLTLSPADHEKKDYTENLKEFGFSDTAILEIVLVTSYFNFVNRIVLSLGIEIEQDNEKGYKY